MAAALTRVIVVAPRLLDEDLQHDAQMSLSEYTVLVHLSEAPDSMLRVAQLADLAYLSGSRMTRLVDQLARDGLVEKERSEHDRQRDRGPDHQRGTCWPQECLLGAPRAA